jgi:hypothetical protein
MHVRFLVDPVDLRRWQADAIASVLAVLKASGDVATVSGQGTLPLLDLCLAFEGMTSCHGRSPLIDRIGLADFGLALSDGRPADLVVDLAGSACDEDRLRLSVGGCPLIAGTAAAITADDEPLLDLEAFRSGIPRVIGRWRLAREYRRSLAAGLAATASRAVEMLTLAACRISAGTAPSDISLPRVDAPSAPHPRRSLALFTGAAFARRLADRLDRLVRTPANWVVTWRFDVTGEGRLPAMDGTSWRRLADDGRRFYADPFVWQHQGRSVLFVEEFPYTTERGILSAVDIGPDGPVGRPRPVIETECHLSYPFVFEQDGVVYMIPETSGRRTIELWRAVEFPDSWEPVAELITGIDASDATLIRTSGRHYLMASLRTEGASSWDGLSIFVADQLHGPYRLVGDGPVKVDVATARSAGRPFMVDGAIIRPFQDSRGGYGAGLGFARIDHLSPDGFAETVLATLKPARPLRGLHTYNRGGGIEVIDVFAPPGVDEVIP